jgi:glucose/arabinose dehydrogenase
MFIVRSVNFAFFAASLILTSVAATNAAEPARVIESGPAEQLALPPPYATRGVANMSRVVAWAQGKLPTAPAGFDVSLFADELENPRTIYPLPNGDVLVMESQRRQGPSRIILLRDDNKDGRPDRREVFIDNLNGAFGMALHGNRLYVGNTDGVVVFPYRTGDAKIFRQGEKILDLPSGGHYTRNILIDAEGKKLYVSVGSTSNIDENMSDAKDNRRAAIMQANLDGSTMRVFAGGLRNAVGLDWEPKTKQLWTVVNERDMLGDDTPPDYLTSVKEGGFYGWPYSYYGQHVDERVKPQRPDLVAKAIAPDYALGAHTASLGLAFYEGTALSARYRGGAFIGQHGSWNRTRAAGYKVIFVPFENGRPTGVLPEDVLTGFVENGDARGRPVGVAVDSKGALLVADDVGNAIWRVTGGVPPTAGLR